MHTLSAQGGFLISRRIVSMMFVDQTYRSDEVYNEPTIPVLPASEEETGAIKLATIKLNIT